MSKWNLVSLKEIVNNLDNKRVPLNSSQRELKESKPLYPYIGANNIMGYIDEYIFDEKILCVAEDGGSWGYNQKCAVLYNEKVWVNNHAHVITAKENLVLEYLMYYLNHTDLNLYINGATRGKLTKSSLESIQVPLPPLPQQQKIANILDAADAVRQNDKALIAKYDELTQALFLDMFGDPVSNPKEWEKVELKKLLRNVSKIGRDYNSTNIEYVDISSIDNSKFLIISTTNYLLHDRPSRAQQILENGDVLLATVRPNLKNIAINNINGFIASTGFYVCRCNDKINNRYLFEVLKSDSVTNYFVGITAGANYPAVKSSDISKLLISLPPIDLQNQFAERVAVIEEQKAIAQKSLEKSESLFNSLLQKAFKGELV